MRAQALSVRRRPGVDGGVWKLVRGSAASLRASLRRLSEERRRRLLEDAWLRFEERRAGSAARRDPRESMEFWRCRPPPG